MREVEQDLQTQDRRGPVGVGRKVRGTQSDRRQGADANAADA